MVIGRDTSKQKRNEKELEDINRFLEFRAEERTADLAVALEISGRARSRGQQDCSPTHGTEGATMDT